MFYNKEQKSYFYIAMATMVVLIVVTFWKPVNFRFKDNTDYNNLRIENAQQEREQYAKYLEQLQADSEASKVLLRELVSKEALREEIETTLKIDQNIAVPDIPDSALNILPSSDEAVIIDYFKQDLSATMGFNKQAVVPTESLFAPESSRTVVASLQSQADALVNNLRGMPVPNDAVKYHKAKILAFEHYGNILDNAASFSGTGEVLSWSDVYRNYAVINDQIEIANTQLLSLDQKYAFTDDLNEFFKQEYASSPLAPSAEAFLGLPDFTFVIGDLPAEIWKAIREALARSFARFAISMLDKLVASIESNFAISSQLLYHQEVSKVYTQEYLDKFVNNPLDQEIIKRFLPQLYCLPRNEAELKQIFTAKAQDYLGFDPATLNPSDPDFYLKLAKSGNFFASPSGQALYYEQQASQAAAEASSAASREVLSPGLKSPRDLVNNQIQRTMASIFNTEQAAISGTIELGTNNVETLAGQLVASVLSNLVDKFLFTIVDGSGASQGGVLLEQKICISDLKSKPLVPSEPTDYEYVPPSENPDDYIPPEYNQPATSVDTPTFR